MKTKLDVNERYNSIHAEYMFYVFDVCRFFKMKFFKTYYKKTSVFNSLVPNNALSGSKVIDMVTRKQRQMTKIKCIYIRYSTIFA